MIKKTEFVMVSADSMDIRLSVDDDDLAVIICQDDCRIVFAAKDAKEFAEALLELCDTNSPDTSLGEA